MKYDVPSIWYNFRSTVEEVFICGNKITWKMFRNSSPKMKKQTNKQTDGTITKLSG